MHVCSAALYSMLSDPECNVFAGLNESDWRDARKLIIKAILGTDMSTHFHIVSQVCDYDQRFVMELFYV